MEEASEGPRPESHSSIVRGVKERVGRVIEENSPKAWEERYTDMWKRFSAHLDGKPREAAAKINPAMRVALKAAGWGTTLLEAVMVGATVVAPAVYVGKKLHVVGKTRDALGFAFGYSKETTDGLIAKLLKRPRA